MQTIKVALAWDWALCKYLTEDNTSAPNSECGLDNFGMLTAEEKTSCWVEYYVTKANEKFNAAPLCVNLDILMIPDFSCEQSGSIYETVDVTDTGCTSNSLYSTFLGVINDMNNVSDNYLRHILAGSDVGTNIGCAKYNALCNPNLGAASFVTGGDGWQIFAHEIGHQLGATGHTNGKEANQGDYIMEPWTNSVEAMLAHISATVDAEGECR